MDRVAVSSSNIASIGYDPDSQTLEVEFHSGGVYQYFQVPTSIHDDFLNASSKGQYLSQNIKNRFPYNQVG